jgi:hypothetical protein
VVDAQEVPTEGYAAGGSLYLVQTIPAAEHTADVYELMRADPGSAGSSPYAGSRANSTTRCLPAERCG